MNFIPSSEINKIKWDNLVLKENALIINLSIYLNAICNSWGVYVDENYSKGIVVNYTQKMGVKTIMTPMFSVYNEFINMNGQEIAFFFNYLKSNFQIGNFNTKTNLNEYKPIIRKCQLISSTEQNTSKLNSLSRRMLKKAVATNIEIKSTDENELVDLIYSKLKDIVKEINQENTYKLKKLCANLKKDNKLISLGIYSANKLKGGLLFYKNAQTIYYILGASETSEKKQGGMYACMNEILNSCQNEALTLHFGGSNIENIRNFYTNLGGQDETYYSYEWDNSPNWYKIIRFIFKKLTKQY